MLTKWLAPFSPRALFAAGEQGAWYDPSDFSSMFQDSGGTTPVTAVGQSVGLLRDKSGRGNHASQSTGGNRPVLQQDGSGFFYLNFDGVNASMAVAGMDLTGSNKLTVSAGLYRAVDTVSQILFETSADSGLNAGAFYVAPSLGTTAFFVSAHGTNTGAPAPNGGAVASPVSRVLTLTADISLGTDAAVLRLNGAQIATSGVASLGTGNFGNYALNIGKRNSATLPFTGRLYQGVIRAAQSSALQIASLERYVGLKMGIAL